MRIRSLVALGGLALGWSLLPLAGLPGGPAPRVARPVLTIGHRGAPAHAPENTLASVDAAHRLGVAWVENDVQRTADGRLVVLHDATLERTTNAATLFPGRSPWRIGDFTLAQVERLDAGAWFGARFAGQRVPTLDGYLRRLDRDHLSLLLEIKNPRSFPGLPGDIAARLRADGWLDPGHLRGRLMVQSFDPDAVRAFHRLCPGARTALLGNPPADRLGRYAGYLDAVNPDASRLTPGYLAAVHAVRGAHRRPLRVFPWTVDDPARAVALARAGADGVITDRPDVIRTALASRAGRT
jgi:glycerophosphoryl diester phosphodiesterase